MAQQNNEHLTNAQLSAYLDKELAVDELALCDAHLQTCQRCQEILTEFRLTSSLLRAMPQVETPRSFALPLTLVALPQTPQSVLATQPPRALAHKSTLFKRSLQTLSTLAAIIGLLFILVGALSALPHGSAGSTTSASTTGEIKAPAQSASGTRTYASPGAQTATALVPATPNLLATTTATLLTKTASAHNQALSNPPDQPAEPPTLLDLSQPGGRLSIGALLLLLGILGMIFTRSTQSRS